MSTIQRITGTNSGLDVDALVKTAMKSYQTKIDKEVQNKKVMEYQQEQYEKIMSDASSFYDKYFDILKSGNLISASSYQTQTFTSSDGSKVTAKGLAGASIDNYTVSVTQLASKATDSFSVTMTGDQKITIGTAEIDFKAVADGSVTVSNYNAAVAAKKKELNDAVKAGTATAQQKTQLADLNNNTITAKYSEFTKNITFTASAFGGSGFTLNSNAKAEDKYLEATIKNSSGVVYNISSTDKKTSNTVTIDNVQFDFKAVGASTSTAPTASLSAINAIDPAAIGGDISSLIELTALTENGGTTTSTAADGTKTTTTTSGTITTKIVTTSSGDKTTITTDTNHPGMTSVVDNSGIITTTDTSNLGYTLKTVKAGATTTTTKTKDDGTIPITKTIETSGTTKTTTTTLKNGSTTTVKKEVNDGINPVTTTSTTELEAADGSTTTVVAADGKTTTTQFKVGSDGKTTKTVTISDGAPLTEVAPLTELASLEELAELTDNGVNGKVVVSDGTTETTTLTSADGTQTKFEKVIADGTITTTTTKAGITTVIASDGKITTTATDGTTTEKATDGTITTTATDGTQTVTASDGTITTTKAGITTVKATNGTISTTAADGTITVKSTDGTITTTKAGKSTVTTAITYNNPTSLTGSTDVSGLKDKIVKFVDEYNTLLLSINTKIFETRNKDYMPLTDEQKEAMTESQITAWEKKAQTGLLRKDSDLERIVRKIKSSMETVISGSGLSLEKIGISPVKNYTDKNGMFTVDEDKLTTALENNAGDVRDLFTREASTSDKGGVMTQLKSALYNEFKVSTSSLSKKAGLAGSSTEDSNTLTKNISTKKKLIYELNRSLSEKENALYKKYSALETAMQKLNSQQSSLTSMLGQS